MSTRNALLCLAAIAISPVALRAQGLVAVQNYSADFKNEIPFQVNVTAQGGYDTLNYKANPLGSFESWFLQAGIGAVYTRPDQTTPLSFSLDTSVVNYIDGMPRFDDTFYNVRASLNFEHRFSERLRISNNMLLTYGMEPNNAFGFGGSTTLWNGQYFYGYNNFNVSYAWTPRFSTTTSYTIDGTIYDDDVIGNAENRYSHLFAQQFAYALNQQTSLTAEYRYRMTIFDSAPTKDYHSHFALVGVDHAWSSRTSGSVRVGAEFYENDRVSNTAPYAEAALNYTVDRQTYARWFASLGYSGAELSGSSSRYGLNTGLQVNHQINKRLSVNGGVSYAYSTFDNPGGVDGREHSIFLNAGLGYQVLDNLMLNAQYSYSTLNSNDVLREFDRHRISLGATASF